MIGLASLALHVHAQLDPSMPPSFIEMHMFHSSL